MASSSCGGDVFGSRAITRNEVVKKAGKPRVFCMRSTRI
jgi:hypothetical protein